MGIKGAHAFLKKHGVGVEVNWEDLTGFSTVYVDVLGSFYNKLRGHLLVDPVAGMVKFWDDLREYFSFFC